MNIEQREDKQILTYEKQVDTGKLMEEIYSNIPTLKPLCINNRYIINLRMFINDTTLTLHVPNNINIEDIDKVIYNHIKDEVIENVVSTN